MRTNDDMKTQSEDGAMLIADVLKSKGHDVIMVRTGDSVVLAIRKLA
jgi:hypothetical protein